MKGLFSLNEFFKWWYRISVLLFLWSIAHTLQSCSDTQEYRTVRVLQEQSLASVGGKYCQYVVEGVDIPVEYPYFLADCGSYKVGDIIVVRLGQVSKRK